ncbi:MAG: cold-shock protein [Alistipes sp.]|nr:cold-shock protein [Alistipes sp.]
MMKGTVKWFDSKKGYGFIIAEDGKEVFVHYTGIVKEGFKTLTEGQLVEYELGNGEKGEQAINVTVVPKPSEA